MAEASRPVLDYASAPAALPPPNDAIGLPKPRRAEALNRPAQWAALLAVMLPWVLLLRMMAPESLSLAYLTGAVMFGLTVLDAGLAVRAVRHLDRAGRTKPVIAVAGIVLFFDVFIALGALTIILFPFGPPR
jgi:hypothetical protein